MPVHLPAGRLFVYGTLRCGGVYHAMLSGARFEGYGRTAAGYTLVDLGPYPAMVAGGHGTVAGEIYRVCPRMLAAVDQLEAHPRLYVRRPIRLADGSVAQAYLASGDWFRAGRRVRGGDYRRRLMQGPRAPRR
ncbi:MAG: gamma-glutamylcyclotransferase [Deltaproteobacteria bacterium]|nr:MAG: gamma-glutamylcyclotransferase [Deltaproteobacteria bacterium]